MAKFPIKLQTIRFSFSGWDINIDDIKDAPGFSDIPERYQAAMSRTVYDKEEAKMYGTHFGNRFGVAFSHHVALGYGNTMRSALFNLRGVIRQSDTPEKEDAIFVINCAIENLKSGPNVTMTITETTNKGSNT